MATFKGWGALALLVLAFAASGCSTMRGAPKPLLDKKLVNSNDFVNASEQLKALKDAASEGDRDRAVRSLMALADVRYMNFRHAIVSNRKNSRAASNGLSLLTDIAATLTKSVGVKDNYIALSALINGGETTYDKEYLFNSTIDALVAQMDANRKAKQVEIYRAMTGNINVYSGQSALADVLDYYYAGSINAAVIGVQKSAANQQEESAKELRSLDAIDWEKIKELHGYSERVGKFVASLNSVEKQQKLVAFLRNEKVDVPQDLGAQPIVVLKQAINKWRSDQRALYPNAEALFAKLKLAGFAVEGF